MTHSNHAFILLVAGAYKYNLSLGFSFYIPHEALQIVRNTTKGNELTSVALPALGLLIDSSPLAKFAYSCGYTATYFNKFS